MEHALETYLFKFTYLQIVELSKLKTYSGVFIIVLFFF